MMTLENPQQAVFNLIKKQKITKEEMIKELSTPKKIKLYIEESVNGEKIKEITFRPPTWGDDDFLLEGYDGLSELQAKKTVRKYSSRLTAIALDDLNKFCIPNASLLENQVFRYGAFRTELSKVK